MQLVFMKKYAYFKYDSKNTLIPIMANNLPKNDWLIGTIAQFQDQTRATYLVNSLSKKSNKNKINFNSIVQGGYFVFSHRGLRCAAAGRIRLESNCCGPFFPINSSSLPLSQSFFGWFSAYAINFTAAFPKWHAALIGAPFDIGARQILGEINLKLGFILPYVVFAAAG